MKEVKTNELIKGKKYYLVFLRNNSKYVGFFHSGNNFNSDNLIYGRYLYTWFSNVKSLGIYKNDGYIFSEPYCFRSLYYIYYECRKDEIYKKFYNNALRTIIELGTNRTSFILQLNHFF